MSRDTRLEEILIGLAQQYAEKLVPASWKQPGDYTKPLSRLAADLAGYNLLVVWGAVPAAYQSTAQAHLQTWVDGYTRLYELLTKAVYPSFTQITITYADRKEPPVVIYRGAATPVIMVLATYVTPYVAVRQEAPSVSQYELRGLVEQVLEELEATDLPRNDFLQLRDALVQQIRALLDGVVVQYRLAEPKEGVFESLGVSLTEDELDTSQMNAVDDTTGTLPFEGEPLLDQEPTVVSPPQAAATMPPPPTALPEERAATYQQDTILRPDSLPDDRPRPPRPDTLPDPEPEVEHEPDAEPDVEPDVEPEPAKRERPFASDVPYFIDFGTRGKDDTQPPPPVPDLPDND